MPIVGGAALEMKVLGNYLLPTEIAANSTLSQNDGGF